MAEPNTQTDLLSALRGLLPGMENALNIANESLKNSKERRDRLADLLLHARRDVKKDTDHSKAVSSLIAATRAEIEAIQGKTPEAARKPISYGKQPRERRWRAPTEDVSESELDAESDKDTGRDTETNKEKDDLPESKKTKKRRRLDTNKEPRTAKSPSMMDPIDRPYCPKSSK